MKSFVVDRTNGDKPLQNDSQFGVYADMSAAEAALPNLEEDQIVGIFSDPVIPPVTDPEDGSLIYYNDLRGEYIPTGTPDNNQVLVSKVTSSGVGFEWKYDNKTNIVRFADRSDALTALAIPEGSAGYLPDGVIVLIGDEEQNLIGVDA